MLSVNVVTLSVNLWQHQTISSEDPLPFPRLYSLGRHHCLAQECSRIMPNAERLDRAGQAEVGGRQCGLVYGDCEFCYCVDGGRALSER